MICGRAALALTAWDDSKFCGRALLATALPFPVPALNYMPVYPWQRVYKATVLERDPARLEEFVQSAFTVIYEHLRARGDITAEESEGKRSSRLELMSEVRNFKKIVLASVPSHTPFVQPLRETLAVTMAK